MLFAPYLFSFTAGCRIFMQAPSPWPDECDGQTIWRIHLSLWTRARTCVSLKSIFEQFWVGSRLRWVFLFSLCSVHRMRKGNSFGWQTSIPHKITYCRCFVKPTARHKQIGSFFSFAPQSSPVSIFRCRNFSRKYWYWWWIKFWVYLTARHSLHPSFLFRLCSGCNSNTRQSFNPCLPY